jgi:hypothetical protein
VNREDFITKSHKAQIRTIVEAKLLELGNKDVKKILVVKIHSINERRPTSHEELESVGDIVQKELNRLKVADRVGCFCIPDNIDISIIDVGEEDGGDKGESKSSS